MTNHNDNLVIYHANCNDGFTAAWIAKRFLSKETEFYPAQHGQEPPAVKGKNVYIVDFSYPRATLKKLHKSAASLHVLDHHKTAQANLDSLDFCTFDMEKSGAMLAWEHFAPNQEPPAIVRYVQDRDLWLFNEWKSREINAVLFSYEHDFELWNEVSARLTHDLEGVAKEGAAILRFQDQQIKLAVNRACEIDVLGYGVKAVNTTVLFSEIAGELAVGRPFGIAWFQRDDGMFVYSLRSRGECGIDVSEIASQFGGGGHEHAAGFQTTKLPNQLHEI